MIDKKLIESSVIEAYKKLILKENVASSEKGEQERISSQIDNTGSRKSKSIKDVDKSNPEVDEEDSDKSVLKGDKEEKDEEKFSYDAPSKVPKDVQFKDIVDQLNHVRSGASLKDEEVKRGLLKYYDNLKSTEKKDLFAMLSGFATIMNKVDKPENALNPSDSEKKDSNKKEKLVKIPNQKKDSPSPIVVGEVASKDREYAIVAESNSKDHRCINGKIVKFGSDRSVKDIDSRITDALQSRDECHRGTEKRSHYNGLLKYLRMQLRAAQKINGNPK